jgi:hypothetical protein
LDILNALLPLTFSKVAKIELRPTWDKRRVESIRLELESGKIVEIYSSSEKGCEHCDEDGVLNNYLNATVREVKI